VNIYMLDTNIASHIIKGDIPLVRQRLVAVPIHLVVVSSVTQAELLYGLAKRSYPKGLTNRVREFLMRVKILAWDKNVAGVYGDLRATCEAAGVTISPLDLMIAAHAQALNATLVTTDKACSMIPDGLKIENWTTPSI
jgi:tRNA(fMet)-specific endonuclease VapC